MILWWLLDDSNTENSEMYERLSYFTQLKKEKLQRHDTNMTMLSIIKINNFLISEKILAEFLI